jgi:3-oxoacyl-[acyl-carrier-protein] synthase III
VVRDKLGLRGRVVPTHDDQPTAMAVRAAELALARAGRASTDVDVVICVTEEYKEYPVWTAGIKLAHDLGASRAYAFDVGQKCGTTVLALKLARDLLVADPDVDVVLVAGGYRNGDLIDLRDPRVRFMYNLGAGAGAIVVERGRGHAIGPAHVVTDGSFSLDVLVPVGGTVAPVTAANAREFRLQVPDPEGMKARLETRSLDNFATVVREAVRKAGATMDEVAYLAMLHVKPSAHAHLLRELGLDEARSIYLADTGHLGQVDQMLSLELAARREAPAGRPRRARGRRRRLRLERHHPPLERLGERRGGAVSFDVAAFRAGLAPDRPAVHADGRWRSYGEMERRAARLAARLHALGVERFDRIAILAHNHLAHLDLWLATAKAGRGRRPLNPRLSRPSWSG